MIQNDKQINVKIVLSIVLLTLYSFVLKAQPEQIDSLINLLSNNEIKGDGNYFGPTFYLTNGPGRELIKIGKRATEKLLNVLSDSTKGVVAHYILTGLWKDSVSGKNPVYIEKQGLTVFTFNELSFFIQRGKVYANNRDLTTNLLLWQAYLKDGKW